MRHFINVHEVVEQKEDVMLWTPNQWKEGNKPTNENVHETHAFVCDFDKISVMDAKVIFAKLKGFAYIAHASYSHKPLLPSFRVILPVSRPIKPEEFKRVWWEVQAIFPKLDKSCKDPRRLWYLPSCHSERKRFYWSSAKNGDIFVDVDALLQQSLKRKPPRKKAPPPKFSNTEDALNYGISKDKFVRIQIAEQLGAKIMERGVAVGVKCPNCHRNSVWFTLQPTDGGWARCNHLNKCGWFGQLTEFME
tara:strand:- start:8432 stop:9178 length:747 start_codon:yes stop_codon:yes gene_type:complete